jgi:hypothetical protein
MRCVRSQGAVWTACGCAHLGARDASIIGTNLWVVTASSPSAGHLHAIRMPLHAHFLIVTQTWTLSEGGFIDRKALRWRLGQYDEMVSCWKKPNPLGRAAEPRLEHTT